MLQLISVALAALMGFSPLAKLVNAAPTHTNAVSMNESPSATAASAVMPMNWNRQDIEGVLVARINEAINKDSMILVKRADENGAAPLTLDTIFRGFFDNIINHIIEVTPLNDIVHGNYDFLYQIFLAKVQEILTGVTGDASATTPAPSDEGDSEYDDDDEDDDSDDDNDDNDDEDNDNHKHWKHQHA
ncbi:hypothetical protein [Parasitella parasitica]|uniref:Uncharacterized protein n=1 Tax=Parasitella parasitica TaxID=35722 RepID=A0A0B7MQJ7_9FUNG|nr:hypothetical protein [Parasitella parasitica]